MTDAHHKARTNLDRDLIVLRDNVLTLSYLVDRAIDQSIHALRERDVALARQVIADDDTIDTTRYDIERSCYRLLALQQPAARDLRAVVTAIHIVVELERIGDHATHIAKACVELSSEPHLKPLIDIPHMAQITRDMMRASLNAYLDWNAPQAERTIERDTEIDQLDSQVYRELLTFMLEDTHTINRAMKLQWIAHNLERAADRVTNICERVIFMVTGEITEAEDHPSR